MTIRYMHVSDSAAFDNSGNSKVVLQPPGGQIWVPKLLRVGLVGTPFNIATVPYAAILMASIYHGTSGDVNVDAFVDRTGRGTSDVTGLLNGSLIQPGEVITGIWNTQDRQHFWQAGQAYLDLVGLTVDTMEEATGILTISQPGEPFSAQISNPMKLPDTGQYTQFSTFNNPGPNGVVNIFNVNDPTLSLYIYDVEIMADATVANASGVLQSGNVAFGQMDFMYYNPLSASADIPLIHNFRGLQMLPTGISFAQVGSAAANSVVYRVLITYRLMTI